MTMLAIKAFARQLFLLLAMAALLFTPAGTLHDWQAWTFLAVYFTSSITIILYLLKGSRTAGAAAGRRTAGRETDQPEDHKISDIDRSPSASS